MTCNCRQIENLIYRYAELMDGGDLDGLAALFRHGRLERPAGVPDAVGIEQVRATYNPHLYADGTPRTVHLTSNVAIEVADDDRTAEARSYFTVLQQTDDLTLQPIVSGRYHDRFHRIDDEWWFESRMITVRLVGDVTHHAKDPGRIHRAGAAPS